MTTTITTQAITNRVKSIIKWAAAGLVMMAIGYVWLLWTYGTVPHPWLPLAEVISLPVLLVSSVSAPAAGLLVAFWIALGAQVSFMGLFE